MSHNGSLSKPVLLVECTPGRFNEVARRIRLQGAQPMQACGLAEATELLSESAGLGGSDLGVAAVLLDVELASRTLKKDLKRLRTASRGLDLFYLAVGEEPEPAVRKKLRSGGVRAALWEPFDDATLRFQLNRAWNADRDDHKRANPRIPTFLHAQIGGGQRVKDGVVYNLSLQGAFIETPRASMAGAIVDVAIRLPNCFVETKARVVFANVPGNLQRPNLPLGMAVRFEQLDAQASKKLKEYVKEHLAQLEV